MIFAGLWKADDFEPENSFAHQGIRFVMLDSQF